MGEEGVSSGKMRPTVLVCPDWLRRKWTGTDMSNAQRPTRSLRLKVESRRSLARWLLIGSTKILANSQVAQAGKAVPH